MKYVSIEIWCQSCSLVPKTAPLDGRSTMRLSQNSTEKINYGFVEPLFTSNEQSLLFSAIAIGQLIGTLPITKIYTRFGLRKLLTAYGFISSLSTLLIVPSIYLGGFATLLILRIFQGFGLAAIWVATGSISAHWSPLSNSGIFLAVLTSSFQLGPITAMPLSAEFCSSEMFGWPAVYYLLGTLSLFFFTIFYWIYRDSPREHEFLSAQELSIIEEGKSLKDISNGRRKRHGKELKQKILYMAILKDLAFWGVYLCSATSNLAFQVFWQFGPIYLNKIRLRQETPLEQSKSGFTQRNCPSQVLKIFACGADKVRVAEFFNCAQPFCETPHYRSGTIGV
uniref:Major facilitator superfamily (MFS) profile domain-containing protein n=1 Tax=Meloidogyne incognita TaxID=6306 RepID=A0A914KYQ8_MELIC